MLGNVPRFKFRVGKESNPLWRKLDGFEVDKESKIDEHLLKLPSQEPGIKEDKMEVRILAITPMYLYTGGKKGTEGQSVSERLTAGMTFVSTPWACASASSCVDWTKDSS